MTITVACDGIVVIMAICLIFILFGCVVGAGDSDTGFVASTILSSIFLGGCITYILWLQGYIK